jgi:hypothetical protein
MFTDDNQLIAWRLRLQLLCTQRLQKPEQVVAWLGGVQAQDYRGAKWSVGLRSEGCTDEEVEQAIQAHKVVRTWMFRGTLHFVHADDLAWLTSLLAPGIIKRNARRYRQLELDEKAFTTSQQVLQQTLERYESLTRAEIKTYFEQQGVPAVGQQVPYLLQRAALDGLICQGRYVGNEPTYVLLSDWVETQQTYDQEEVLGILARRYFSSHAPATLKDFSWWSGLGAKDVRLAIEITSELESIDFDGKKYWTSSEIPPTDITDCGCLLPPFDDYLIGYKERTLVLDPQYSKRVNPGGGMPKPTVMVKGNIVGVWKYQMKKGVMLITIELFEDLEPHDRDFIDQAVNQFSEFKSLPVEANFERTE